MTRQTDIAALERLIRWPAKPESAVWQTRTIGEGTDWALLAVLTYAPGEMTAVLASAPETPGLDGAVMFMPFDWTDVTVIPGLVIAADGSATVVGGSRSAEAFLSSPLTDGFVLAIPGQNQVLVFLYTS